MNAGVTAGARKPTAREMAFMLERALIAHQREQLVETVRDFIKTEHPVDEETWGLEVQELIEEMLRGTGWVLRGDIDYATDAEREEE